MRGLAPRRALRVACQIASALDTSITGLGWVVLIVSIVLPVGLFAVAFLLGAIEEVIHLVGERILRIVFE